MASPEVVVVGGGVIGCAVAFELASRHGVRALVLERAVPGAEASSAAAGILGAQLEAQHSAAGNAVVFDFLLASRARHPDLDARLRELLGFGTGYVKCGALKVTLGSDPAATVAAFEWQKAAGARVVPITGDDARRLEPALAPTVTGGVELPDEGQVDPPLLLRALQQGCAALGVQFRSGVIVRGVATTSGAVRGVDTSGGLVPASAVVVAAGSWSSMVEGVPSEVAAVRPVRGQIVQCETRPPLVRRVVFGERGYVLARPDGRTILGSTMEEVGHVKEVTVSGLSAILAHSLGLFPGLAAAPVTSTWAGFRPATPDQRPLLGPTAVRGLFHATGHHRNGILLAPETARVVADLVATGRSDRDLTPFAPARS